MSPTDQPAGDSLDHASWSTQPPLRTVWARWKPTSIFVGAALLLGVLTVLVAVAWAPLITVDHAAVFTAHAMVAPHPDLVMIIRAVTDAGSPISVDVITGVVAVAFLLIRRFRAALYMVVVRGVELGMETALKNALDRPRPAPSIGLTTASGASFPSGHTAGTAAVCVALLVLFHPRLGRHGQRGAAAAVVFFIAAVGSSRVLLGVHFPSDVIGGALLGTFVAVAVGVLLYRH